MDWSTNKKNKSKDNKPPRCHFCGELCIKNYYSNFSFAMCNKCREVIHKWLKVEVWVMGNNGEKRPKGKRF